MLSQVEMSINVGQTFDIMVQALTQDFLPTNQVSLQLQLQNLDTSYDTIGPIPPNLVYLQAATPTFNNGIYTFSQNQVHAKCIML